MPNADGLDVFKSTDLDETEEAVKTTSGKVYGWSLYNSHATDTRFVKFYDGLVASVVVGTTVPKATVAVKALTSVDVVAEVGIRFDTAITVAATTGVGDTDTGAPGASEVLANIFYR